MSGQITYFGDREPAAKAPTPADAVEVAVALPVFGTYTYRVPDSLTGLAACGKRVLVPFGRRRVTGYVMGDAEPSETVELKDLLDVLDARPLFPPSMVAFFRWLADYYCHPVGGVISGALPGGLNLYDETVYAVTAPGLAALEGGLPTPLEIKILHTLAAAPCGLKALQRKIGDPLPRALILTLLSRGEIRKTRKLRAQRTKPRTERVLTAASPPDPANRLSAVKQRILDEIRDHGHITVSQLKSRIPTASNHIAALESAGWIRVRHCPVYRDPFGEPIEADRPPALTREQASVFQTVKAALNGGYRAYLLDGVTGSGKTEVYMRLAAEALSLNLNVIVLVPEIALITQMERRFRARFGERVALIHSGLSAGERLDQWVRIIGGEALIAIGARSALFAPFDRVGLIVVDEEHDASYKQDGGLRYNARDAAVVRASQDRAVVVLGSATPSVQSMHNVQTGKFKRVVLSRRVFRQQPPEITVVDLKTLRNVRGVGRLLSPVLLEGMKTVLDRGEQVLLFLNRRGYAGYPVCAACGENLRCSRCDVSLTLHLKAHAYQCHYCGLMRPGNLKCPACGADKIRRLGMGTEKIESVVRELFPSASVARMDRDTTARKGAIVKLLKGLRNRTIDILVGTQMVTKGHDFPHITLVGIVCADLSLSFPDFRAAERTYQLLAQVAGRAGRGELPGRVVLQTYNPDHFSIRHAGQQDYRGFFEREIAFRSALKYPPFSRFIQLRVSSRDPSLAAEQAGHIGDLCRRLAADRSDRFRSLEVLGPVEAPLAKIAGRYRWRILLKGRGRANELRVFVRQLLAEHSAIFNSRNVRVAVDVDPYFMT